jgi:hypothetical protein
LFVRGFHAPDAGSAEATADGVNFERLELKVFEYGCEVQVERSC